MRYKRMLTLRCSFAAALALAGAFAPTFTPTAYADQGSKPKLTLPISYFDQVGSGAPGAMPQPGADLLATPTPRECKPRYMAGPGTGMALGAGAITGGALMVTAGNLQLFDSPKTRRERGLIAGGSVLMAAGVAALIYSSVRLAKNRYARQSVCR